MAAADIYNRIATIVDGYLRTPTSDYAYMICGEWGTGKTHFVKHILPDIVKGIGKSTIYVSLNGALTISEVKRKVFLGYMSNKTGRRIDPTFVDTFLEIGQSVPKLDVIFRPLKTAIDKMRNSAFETLDLTNSVLVFDDLERISEKIRTTDILGAIYDLFVEKGVKTFVVGNESEIDTKDYHHMKEKIFRRVISFEPNRMELLKAFLTTRYGESRALDTLLSKVVLVNRVFEEMRRQNLRTLAFCADCYSQIIDFNLDEIAKAHLDVVFDTLLVLAIEHKAGNITRDDAVDKRDLQLINRQPFFYGLKEKLEDDKTYAEKTYEFYVEKLGIKFVFFDTLFDLVVTGYVDQDAFKAEMNEKFASKSAAWDRAADQLFDFREMEESEFLSAIGDVIEYLTQGKYSLKRLHQLYPLFRHIEELCLLYGGLDGTDVPVLFEQALLISSNIPTNIPTVQELSMFRFETTAFRDDPFMVQLTDTARKKASELELDKQKGKIEALFAAANEKDGDFVEIARSVDSTRLFQVIEKTVDLDRFLQLTARGIYSFQSLLYVNITSIGNAGQYQYGEKEPLLHIAERIRSKIDQEVSSIHRRQRMNEFVKDIKKAVTHIENTKPTSA